MVPAIFTAVFLMQSSIAAAHQPAMRRRGLLTVLLLAFMLSLFFLVFLRRPPPHGQPHQVRGGGFPSHYILASPAWVPPSLQFSMVLPVRVSPVFFTMMV